MSNFSSRLSQSSSPSTVEELQFGEVTLGMFSIKGICSLQLWCGPGWHKLLQAGRRLARTDRIFEYQEVSQGVLSRSQAVLIPQSSILGPRSSILGLQSSVLSPLGPRSSFLSLQSSVFSPRSSILGPQSSFPGPQSSILNP